MKATWLDSGEPIDAATLRAEGIHAQTLDLGDFEGPLQQLIERNGYVTQDEVALAPDTPDLDAICDRFVAEHQHAEDEVRFVLEGEGTFDIRALDDRWMHVVVQPGDLVIVPAGRHHRFYLTDTKTIRARRVFKDPAGWVPIYREPAAG